MTTVYLAQEVGFSGPLAETVTTTREEAVEYLCDLSEEVTPEHFVNVDNADDVTEAEAGPHPYDRNSTQVTGSTSKYTLQITPVELPYAVERDLALGVLEDLREELGEDEMASEASTLNEAHYLIQEYGGESEDDV